VGRGFALDDRLDVFVLGIEAAKEVEDLAGLGDGVADVAEIVGEALELGAVIVNTQVALLQTAKFGLEVDSSLELVVAEEGLNIAPESERRSVRLVDDLENRLSDGVIEPIDDAMINLTPFRRSLGHGWRGADVIFNSELAKNRIEETTPLAVVGIVEIKKNRDVGTNVHSLN
jgi:hypothetical protein